MASKTTMNRPTPEQTQTSVHAEPLSHGSSPAAWTCVFVMLFGALVSSIGYIWASYNMGTGTVLFWIGPVIMVIGLILGWLLRRAGYGVGGSKVKHH